MDIDWQEEPNAPPPGTLLCPLGELNSGRIREFYFGADKPFRLLVYRKADDLFAYVNQCPHHWLAMNREPDKFLFWDENEVMCGHHNAVFRLTEGGVCIEGPCKGSNLTVIPLQIIDGLVHIAQAGR